MGLDNGFILKGVPKKDLPSCARHDPVDKDEIIYWRKYWGIRNSIFYKLHLIEDFGKFDYQIDKEDIPAIIEILTNYLDEEYWEAYGESIWTYEEAKENIINSIVTLYWIYDNWNKYPNINLIFYDSY